MCCLACSHAQANSHKDFGWQQFTDAVIQCLNERKQHVVFVLWGGQAHLKGARIDARKHLVLKSPHPSGLSANRATADYPSGFFHNRHFQLANAYLVEHGLAPIDWKLSR